MDQKIDKMGYEEVTSWIFGLKRFDSKPSLKHIRHLLKLMGNPYKRYKTILVGGTSGKGSTAKMIASVLQEAGYKVGIFTKPHLSSYTERIVVDDKKIPEGEVVRLVNNIKPFMDRMSADPNSRHPTFFEVTTAIALEYFARKNADFAVLEVGMGSNLDATNVVDPLVSVITNVYLEHTKILGKTVEEIARKKAGIIKRDGILVTATDNEKVFELFKRICKRKNSRLFRVGEDIKLKKLSSSIDGQTFQVRGMKGNFDNMYTGLLGNHQTLNAATAIGTIEALGYHDINIPKRAVFEGLKKVKWPGRLEIMQKRPLVVLDCAKDPTAARKLKEAMLDEFEYDKLILVVSISSDKDIQSMIGEMAPMADHVIITRHKVMGRAADPARIAAEVKKHSKPFVIMESVKDGVRKALLMANKNDMVCVTGSVFTVGEARELWHKEVNFRLGCGYKKL